MISTKLINRLINEITEINRSPPENCSAGPIDDNDFLMWEGKIFGPINTIYYGGIYTLKIKVPLDYPKVPPKMKFTTKMFHPNIDTEGHICLNLLGDDWNQTLTISKILLAICLLLTNPNTDDPLNYDASHMYEKAPTKYINKVKYYVMKYAH